MLLDHVDEAAQSLCHGISRLHHSSPGEMGFTHTAGMIELKSSGRGMGITVEIRLALG